MGVVADGSGSVAFGCIFLKMFKDNVVHDLSCLPIILGSFGPKIRKIPVTWAL